METMKAQSDRHDGQRAGPQRCKLIRRSLFGSERRWFWRIPSLDLDTRWVRQHVAQCPRCQNRFNQLGRVELALQLAKTQPHSPELLARANRQAFKILRRPLRQTVQAETLKVIRPAPSRWQQAQTARRMIGQIAACVALLLLGKIGFLGSIHGAQTRTENAVRSYFSQRLGHSLAEEVFPD